MLLSITTSYSPPSDLGFLLHKHPDKLGTVETSGGCVHFFYPVANDEQCTFVLLLDVDPVSLVRKENPHANDFSLQQYVNDRPYVASSFLSTAISKACSSALNGICKNRPELLSVQMPFKITIPVLPVSGGEQFARDIFEPLGYSVLTRQLPLDSTSQDWGLSRYHTITLSNTLTLQRLLSHLYVLMPVCDNNKHYWVSKDEVTKLLEKGKDWLDTHPAKDAIIKRYLKYQRELTGEAMQTLRDEVELEPVAPGESEEIPLRRIHELRLEACKEELLKTGAKRILDLGCGDGKLLKLLLEEKSVEYVLGMDVSYRAIQIAGERLKVLRMNSKERSRINVIQGSLIYRDRRLEGFDAAALIEVIEHLDEHRLDSFERSVFGFARPGTIIITTPNADYNKRFEDYKHGKMRHLDHRFEWSREQFLFWGERTALQYGYSVKFKAVGEEDSEAGALTQMGIFTKEPIDAS